MIDRAIRYRRLALAEPDPEKARALRQIADEADRGVAVTSDWMSPAKYTGQPPKEPDRDVKASRSRATCRAVAALGQDEKPRVSGDAEGQGGVFITTGKDAFDQWWEWVTGGRVGDFETIPAEIRDAVMMLTPAERFDREIVNEAVRRQATPRRPAGSADQYGVPVADENAPEPVEEE
jgi:hypothetical protein